MNDYNGFTSTERTRAFRWLKAQIEAGWRRPPKGPCDACGQAEGFFQHHSEDYSEPYGENIGEFVLCYPCHMVLHCRHRSPMTWDLYRQRVREGLHLEKAYVGAHWHVFRLSVLQNFAGLKWAQGRPPVRFVLDEIHDGVHDPRRSQR